MTTPPTPRLLALVACTMLLAAGCGGDEEGQGIPDDSAGALQRQLDSIQSRFESGGGACQDIVEGEDTNIEVVRSALDSLPRDVDGDVRAALTDSFDHLFELIRSECDEEPEEQTTPTETTPPETTPTETETETQPTETVPPVEPEKPEKEKEKEEKKKEKGEGNSGGGEAPSEGGGGGALAPEGD